MTMPTSQQAWAPVAYAGHQFQPEPPFERRYDEQAKRRAGLVFLLIMAASVGIIVKVVFFGAGGGNGFRVPALVGGMPRLDDDIAAEMMETGTAFDDDAEQLTATYGVDGPRYMLMALRRPGKPSTFFDDLNAKAGEPVVQPVRIGSVACANEGEFSLCAWGTGSTIGTVSTVADISLPDLARITEEARASVEA